MISLHQWLCVCVLVSYVDIDDNDVDDDDYEFRRKDGKIRRIGDDKDYGYDFRYACFFLLSYDYCTYVHTKIEQSIFQLEFVFSSQNRNHLNAFAVRMWGASKYCYSMSNIDMERRLLLYNKLKFCNFKILGFV